MLTETEMAALEAATTEEEWNAACDAIKAARAGEYPPDWYARVMASGLMHRKAALFGYA